MQFGLEEYLELVDTMGRAVHPGKLIELAAHRQQRALRGLAAARRVFEAKAA